MKFMCPTQEIWTILYSARSMIHSNDVPLELWPEAVNIAVYVLNRTFSKQVSQVKLHMQSNRNPNISHLKIFGSYAYMHKPKELKTKWDV